MGFVLQSVISGVDIRWVDGNSHEKYSEHSEADITISFVPEQASQFARDYLLRVFTRETRFHAFSEAYWLNWQC